MDLIITEINSNIEKYNATIQYSTLSDYFDHLHSLNFKFPVMRGLDFEFGWPKSIPQGTTGNTSVQYQTGAPASRASHKQNIRKTAALTRAAQSAHAMAFARNFVNSSRASDFMVAWDANGVCSHHDSTPGTARSTVTAILCPSVLPAINGIDACQRCGDDPDCQVIEDYTARLDEAQQAISQLLIDSIQAVSGSATPPSLIPTPTVVQQYLLYNPLPHDRTELVHIAFTRPSGILTSPTVRDMSSGATILAQLEANDTTLTQAPNLLNPYSNVVCFMAPIPAFGFSTFTIEFNPTQNSTTTVYPSIVFGAVTLANYNIKVLFDNVTNLMTSVINLIDNLQMDVSQTYWNYVDGQGGAYCLIEQAPAVPIPLPYNVITVSGKKKFDSFFISHVAFSLFHPPPPLLFYFILLLLLLKMIILGPVFQEVTQTYAYGLGLQQRIRLCTTATVVEIDHAIGVLPGGREIISRLSTDLQTGPHLFTDASGFKELQDRVLNVSGPIAQNYHPFVQTAVLTEASGTSNGVRELALLTRRTMGVASLTEGQVEYMLLRRLQQASDFQG